MQLTFYTPDKFGYTIHVPADEMVAHTIARLMKISAVKKDVEYIVFDHRNRVVLEFTKWKDNGAVNGAVYYVYEHEPIYG